MDQERKIELVRQMVGSEDITHISDDDIIAYLKVAGEAIIRKRYPYGPPDGYAEVPEQFDALHCEITTYLISKRGAEGEIVHAENGIDRSYESGYIPNSMLRGILPYCGVI